MDQTNPALDPLRNLADAALARQEAAQRQQADDQAAADRDQTLAEAQQLAAKVFGPKAPS